MPRSRSTPPPTPPPPRPAAPSPPPAAAAGPSPPPAAAAPGEVPQRAHGTLQLRLVRSGEAGCHRWHGPYWYAFYRESAPIGSAGARKAGKTRCTYIGRTLPAELASALASK